MDARLLESAGLPERFNPSGTPFSTTGPVAYHSYSGTDIIAQFVIPGEAPQTLGELQTISYSIHRENTPVRFLGHVTPVGFVKGPRTIAGSLIFTQFHEYAFYRLAEFRREVSRGMYPLGDMAPPIDISITFLNEYGRSSVMKILGVSIIDEGATMSVEDLIVEQTYTYMARSIIPIVNYNPAGPTSPDGDSNPFAPSPA